MTKRKSSRIDHNDRFRHQNSKFHFTITKPNFPSQKGADTDPKTSEYAFFKKLKKDAGLGVHSHPVQKDADQSKKPESRGCSRERTSDVEVHNKGFNCSRIIKDTSTIQTASFFSPSDGALNNSDPYSMSIMHKKSRGCGDTFEPQGNQFMHGEIFSRKRQKLHQCVGDALFPDMERLCSKRHDIVSVLLSRLFPTSIPENKYQDPNPEKAVNSTTGYDLLDCQESDSQFKEHHQIPTRKLLELESSSYFNDHLLSPMLLGSDERFAPRADFPNPGNVVNATTGYDLFDSREVEAQFKEHLHVPTRKLLEFESGSYFSDHLLPPMLLRSDERVAPHTEFPNPWNIVNANTGCDLLDSREVEAQFKENHQIPTRKLLEFEPSSDFSDHLLSPMFLTSDEGLTPHAEYHTSHFHKLQPLYSITEPEYKFSGNPSFSAKSNASVELLYDEVFDVTRNGLFDSQESDVRFKEHHQTPKTKLIEFESNSYIKDNLLSPILHRSNGRITPHTDFHAPHSLKFLPLHSITEPACEFGGAPSFNAMSDATRFLFNEQNHEIFTSNYFKDLGKLEREPIPLLLEKDYECTEDEMNLPISYKYANPDIVPALSTLGNGEEQMLKNILGEYHFKTYFNIVETFGIV